MYVPAATHWKAAGHDTSKRFIRLNWAALAGSGAWIAVQVPPESVSSTPYDVPDESPYHPVATHPEGAQHDTSRTPGTPLALPGMGA